MREETFEKAIEIKECIDIYDEEISKLEYVLKESGKFKGNEHPELNTKMGGPARNRNVDYCCLTAIDQFSKMVSFNVPASSYFDYINRLIFEMKQFKTRLEKEFEELE